MTHFVFALTTSSPAGSSFEPIDFLLVYVGTFAVLAGVVDRWQGVTLTGDEMLVHNLQRRVIVRRDILSITVEPLLWTRTVVVRESSGRRTRLRAPSTGPLSWDRDFDAKYRTIGEWARLPPWPS